MAALVAAAGALQQLVDEVDSVPAVHPVVRWPAWWPVLVLVLVGFGGVAVRRPPRTWTVDHRLRANHLVPVVLQSLIFAYWWLYFPSGVAAQLPKVLEQLVFAFAVDALIALGVRGRWRLTFGPVPVVLATNLFIWFPDRSLWGFVVIALAIASKTFLTRDGRHLFNPAAFGIVATSLLAYPWFGWVGEIPGHLFNLAPQMTELVLLLGILPQMRFSIVHISLFAFLGIETLDALSGLGLEPPAPTWATVVLVFTLFATDPMTSPRTGGGQVLYGFLLGITIPLCSEVLDLFDTDAIAKILPIPFLALLVPWFERCGRGGIARLEGLVPGVLVVSVLPVLHLVWGAVPHTVVFGVVGVAAVVAGAPMVHRGAPGRWGRHAADAVLSRRWTLVHVAVWILVVTMAHEEAKPRLFEANYHAIHGTPTVVFDDDGVARCGSNPAFCRPWKLGAEWSAWRTRDEEGTEGD